MENDTTDILIEVVRLLNVRVPLPMDSDAALSEVFYALGVQQPRRRGSDGRLVRGMRDGIRTRDHLHKIGMATVGLMLEGDGQFPSHAAIRKCAGVDRIGGAGYLVALLREVSG